MNKIGKEMMTRDLLQFRFYTEEELVRMYMDALEVIDNLQSKIDKAVEYINKEYDTEPHELYGLVSADELLNILNDDKNKEIPQFKGTMEQLDDLCNIRKE